MSCNGRPGQPRLHQSIRDALIAMHPHAVWPNSMPIERLRVILRENGCCDTTMASKKKENRLLEWESCFGMCRHVICC